MSPKVSIIILNWNGWKDTIECLESLYQITYPNYDVIVVDNGSWDDSVENIKKWADGKIPVGSNFFKYNPEGKPIKYVEYTREEGEIGGGKEKEIRNFPFNKKLIIIKNEKNYGFAEGADIGIKSALKTLNPDYILILNNDTVVDKEFLSKLVKVAESNERIGICGSKMPNYYDSAGYDGLNIIGYIDIFGYAGSLEIHKEPHKSDVLKEVPYICGGCMLVNKMVVKKVDPLFDPSYFVYHEDVDACWRARLLGYKVFYVPDAIVYHKVSVTTKKHNINAYYFAERNRLANVIRNYEMKTLLLLSPLLIGNEIVRILPLIFLKRFGAKLRGWIWIIKNIEYIMSMRKKIQGNRIASDRELLSLHIIGLYKFHPLLNRAVKYYCKFCKIV